MEGDQFSLIFVILKDFFKVFGLCYKDNGTDQIPVQYSLHICSYTEMQLILESSGLYHASYTGSAKKLKESFHISNKLTVWLFNPKGVRWPVFIYCVLGTIWKSYACMIRKQSYCIALFSIIMVCDLYFNSHILLCLCITLILILYIISIKCVYVREYYGYSLTAIKSLL